MNIYTSPSAEAAEEAEDQSVLSIALEAVLSNKLFIIIVTIIFALGGDFLYRTEPPSYRADILLRLTSSSPSMMSQLDGGEAFMRSGTVDTEIRIMTSRMMMSRVAKNLGYGLTATPTENPFQLKLKKLKASLLNEGWQHPDMQIYSVYSNDNVSKIGGRLTVTSMSPTGGAHRFRVSHNGIDIGTATKGEIFNAAPAVDARFIIVDATAAPGDSFVVKPMTARLAANRLARMVNARVEGRNQSLIRISSTGTDQDLVYRVLGTLADSYTEYSIETRAERESRSIDFIEQQLPLAKENLETARIALNKYLSENKELVLQGSDEQHLLKEIIQVEQLITEIDFKIANLKEKLQPAHPAVESLDRQRSRLLISREDLKAELAVLPKSQQILLKLKREVSVAQNLVNFFLSKSEELKMAKAGTVSNVHVIDEPYFPQWPFSPKRSDYLLNSALLGCLSAIGFLLLRRVLSQTLKQPAEVEKATGKTIYATIPLSNSENALGNDGQDRILAKAVPADLAVESMRSARTALHFALKAKNGKSVLITGSAPAVGKSFISANISYVMAATGLRVLLIDGDMRKGTVHKRFGLDRSPGLSELICVENNTAVLNTHSIEIKDSAGSLDVIPSGVLPPNPSELLMNAKFDQLIKAAENDYDLVVIDGPPILAVTDACIIGNSVSVSLLVVRYGMTHKGEATAAIRQFENSGATIDGIILNAYIQSKNALGYYYNYAYYQYAYDDTAGSTKG